MVERPAYSLPIVALVLSICGLCTCLSSLAGIILGIVSLFRIKKEPQLPGRGMAIAAIVVGVGIIPIQLGVLAAIAIPSFIRYQARSKQVECKVALRRLWKDQEAYRAANGAYAAHFSDLHFRVPAGNGYAYLLSETDVVPVDPRYRTDFDPADAVHSLGIGLKDGEFLAACVGNIDQDSTLDVWTVSSADRSVPAGTPQNDVNDVVE